MGSLKAARTAYAITVHSLLGLGSLAFLLPLLWMLSIALKLDAQLFAYPPEWIPKPPQWSNFVAAIEYFPFWRYFWNSTVVTVLAVFGQVFSAAIVAYGFAKLRWPGREVVFFLVLATLMIP